jgi:hypothetical protein
MFRALKDAADVIMQSPTALQLRYLQTLTTIASEKNSTIVFPIPVRTKSLAYYSDRMIDCFMRADTDCSFTSLGRTYASSNRSFSIVIMTGQLYRHMIICLVYLCLVHFFLLCSLLFLMCVPMRGDNFN